MLWARTPPTFHQERGHQPAAPCAVAVPFKRNLSDSERERIMFKIVCHQKEIGPQSSPLKHGLAACHTLQQTVKYILAVVLSGYPTWTVSTNDYNNFQQITTTLCCCFWSYGGDDGSMCVVRCHYWSVFWRKGWSIYQRNLIRFSGFKGAYLNNHNS